MVLVFDLEVCFMLCWEFFPSPSDFSLKGLYHLLQDSVRQLKLDRPVCLVIDDLSVVLSVGVGVREVGDFVHYCQQLLCAPDGVCKVT